MSHAIRIATTFIAIIAAIGLMACSPSDKYEGTYRCAGISKKTRYAESRETGRRSNDPVEKKAESFLVFIYSNKVSILLVADTPRYSNKQTIFTGSEVTEPKENDQFNSSFDTSFLLDLEKKTLTIIRTHDFKLRDYDVNSITEFTGTCQKE